AEQRDELAAGDLEADVVECRERAVALGDGADRDGQGHRPVLARSRHPASAGIHGPYCCRNASKRFTISSAFSTHQSTDMTKPLSLFCGELGRPASFSGGITPAS